MRLAALADEVHQPSFAIDRREAGAAELVVVAAIARHGRLDALVCTVCVVAFGSVASLGEATLEWLFAVNVLAPIRLSRATLAVLPAGGRIVNISAIAAERPMAGLAACSATKAALTAFDAALGRECRHQEIRVLDRRPPHLEGALSDRPIAGASPRRATGVDFAVAARRIAAAMAADLDEVET